MTVFELINQMSREKLEEFLYMLMSGCECYGDCPLENLGKFTCHCYECQDEGAISKWLDSECSEKQINEFLG